MARPRRYIMVGGRTVDGVSRHQPTGRYYILDRSGRRVYFRKWEEAIAAYQADRLASASEVDRAKLEILTHIRYAAAMDRVRGEGREMEADDSFMEQAVGRILTEGDRALVQLWKRMNAIADEHGVPLSLPKTL